MTTIDIILFCYKQEQYIEQALQSIYDQQVPDDCSVRIIVADDCSPDNTLALIEKHVGESPFPITFLPQEPNVGISKNYKRSFAATTADYVFILEGDDYWLPGHVMQHVEFLTAHPECSMSFNILRILEEETGQMYDWKQSEPYKLVDTKMQILQGNLLGNLSGCCFRGNCVRELPVSLFDIHIADWMLGVMMTEMGPIGRLQQPTNVYRVKASGVWAGHTLWQQHLILLRCADAYDSYQNGKYHIEWKEFKRGCWREVRRNWMHYVPVWMQNTWHKIKSWIKK